MKNLIEIAGIVTKKKVRKIEIFDDHSLKTKNSKFNEFYEALLNGKFKTDRDASTFLYDCSPTDDKYRQLKSRFRKRLLNTLFFLDVNLPSTSNYDRAYYTCNKDWTLVKILLSNGAVATAADQAQQILTIALKFHFADIIVNCSSILRQYCAESDNEKDYEMYDQYIKQYSNILEAEIRSEEFYQRVIMHYYKSASKISELRDKIDTYCEALIGLSEMYDSPVIFYNMYLVWAYRYEMSQDYEAMLEVCTKAEKYIEDHPTFYQDGKLATFQIKKMMAFLHLRDYKRGRVNAEKCLQSFPEGTDTWFTFMECYILLAMHTENFINALAIYTKAISNPKFKKLSSETREKWNVYDVILNWIVEIKNDNSPLWQAQKRRPFKLTRFLNDPILFPKDQRVFTLHLVIGQILFLLEKKQFVAASERIDRLKNYANRQLKAEDNFRAIQFIRLLQQLPKADYNPKEFTNAEKYHQRLLKSPFSYRGLLQEWEIIPYEKLWDMILERLQVI
jgi:hypothetical protein